MRTFQFLLLAAVLAGCASGSPPVISQVRPAIEDYTTVTILTEMPEDAEQIATVKASSESGLSYSRALQRQEIDTAIEELRQQAAKVGANAVVITSASPESSWVSTGDGKSAVLYKGVSRRIFTSTTFGSVHRTGTPNPWWR